MSSPTRSIEEPQQRKWTWRGTGGPLHAFRGDWHGGQRSRCGMIAYAGSYDYDEKDPPRCERCEMLISLPDWRRKPEKENLMPDKPDTQPSTYTEIKAKVADLEKELEPLEVAFTALGSSPDATSHRCLLDDTTTLIDYFGQDHSLGFEQLPVRRLALLACLADREHDGLIEAHKLRWIRIEELERDRLRISADHTKLTDGLRAEVATMRELLNTESAELEDLNGAYLLRGDRVLDLKGRLETAEQQIVDMEGEHAQAIRQAVAVGDASRRYLELPDEDSLDELERRLDLSTAEAAAAIAPGTLVGLLVRHWQRVEDDLGADYRRRRNILLEALAKSLSRPDGPSDAPGPGAAEREADGKLTGPLGAEISVGQQEREDLERFEATLSPDEVEKLRQGHDPEPSVGVDLNSGPVAEVVLFDFVCNRHLREPGEDVAKQCGARIVGCLGLTPGIVTSHSDRACPKCGLSYGLELHCSSSFPVLTVNDEELEAFDGKVRLYRGGLETGLRDVGAWDVEPAVSAPSLPVGHAIGSYEQWKSRARTSVPVSKKRGGQIMGRLAEMDEYLQQLSDEIEVERKSDKIFEHRVVEVEKLARQILDEHRRLPRRGEQSYLDVAKATSGRLTHLEDRFDDLVELGEKETNPRLVKLEAAEAARGGRLERKIEGLDADRTEMREQITNLLAANRSWVKIRETLQRHVSELREVVNGEREVAAEERIRLQRHIDEQPPGWAKCGLCRHAWDHHGEADAGGLLEGCRHTSCICERFEDERVVASTVERTRGVRPGTEPLRTSRPRDGTVAVGKLSRTIHFTLPCDHLRPDDSGELCGGKVRGRLDMENAHGETRFVDGDLRGPGLVGSGFPCDRCGATYTVEAQPNAAHPDLVPLVTGHPELRPTVGETAIGVLGEDAELEVVEEPGDPCGACGHPELEHDQQKGSVSRRPRRPCLVEGCGCSFYEVGAPCRRCQCSRGHHMHRVAPDDARLRLGGCLHCSLCDGYTQTRSVGNPGRDPHGPST